MIVGNRFLAWGRGDPSANGNYWRFRDHCIKIHAKLYGANAEGYQSLKDIIADELYKEGARMDIKPNGDLWLDFNSGAHLSLWLIKWSSR